MKRDGCYCEPDLFFFERGLTRSASIVAFSELNYDPTTVGLAVR